MLNKLLPTATAALGSTTELRLKEVNANFDSSVTYTNNFGQAILACKNNTICTPCQPHGPDKYEKKHTTQHIQQYPNKMQQRTYCVCIASICLLHQ